MNRPGILLVAATCSSAIAALTVPCPASAEFAFLDSGSSPAGDKPAGMVVADFNHDGRPDVIAARDYTSSVSVLLGSGTAQFAPPVSYASAPDGRIFHHPQPLAAGDFNGDGKPDYAVTSQYGGPFYVSVALGVGNGTFLAQTLQQAGTCPTSVVAVDTNHDGKLDLITTNSEGSSISVLLGNGNGTFQPRTEFDSGDSPISNVSADFNGDGHADIAQVSWGVGRLTILLGAGNGQFGAPTHYTVGANPRSLVAADFDHDGIVDIAVANGEGASISVVKGYGDGSFAPAIEYPLSSAGWVDSEPNSIVAADLDADGNLDLAVADFRMGTVEIFRGSANGIFGLPQIIPLGTSPSTIAAADFNADGSPDLAVLDYESGSLSVLINDVLFNGSFD